MAALHVHTVHIVALCHAGTAALALQFLPDRMLNNSPGWRSSPVLEGKSNGWMVFASSLAIRSRLKYATQARSQCPIFTLLTPQPPGNLPP